MSLLIKTENNYHANLNEADINNKQIMKPLFSSKIKSPWKIILVEPIKKNANNYGNIEDETINDKVKIVDILIIFFKCCEKP